MCCLQSQNITKDTSKTADTYFKTLQNLKTKTKVESHDKLNDGIILLYNNVMLHKAHKMQTLIQKFKYNVLSYSSYSPDLACVFHLFENERNLSVYCEKCFNSCGQYIKKWHRNRHLRLQTTHITSTPQHN